MSMKLWCVITASCLAAVLSVGCGGSADSLNDDNTVIQNDSPNVYNAQNVLAGSWTVIDQNEINISAQSGDSTLQMQLVTASLSFTNANISSTSGQVIMSSLETWHMFLVSSNRTYLGPQNFVLNEQAMSLVKFGADQWRCEIYDEYRTVMNINILSENVIQVEEHRIAELDNGSSIDYQVTFTMRKDS